MDLKHSNVPEVTVVADAYMPGSKSSDLIKPPINGSSATLDNPALPPGEFKVYKRRWLVLAIFVMYSASNALQWIQYSIIANIVQSTLQLVKTLDRTSIYQPTVKENGESKTPPTTLSQFHTADSFGSTTYRNPRTTTHATAAVNRAAFLVAYLQDSTNF